MVDSLMSLSSLGRPCQYQLGVGKSKSLCHSFCCPLYTCSSVLSEVAFSQPTYVTSENDNNVTVCVQVISPPMLPGVPMFVTFMTSDITAIG